MKESFSKMTIVVNVTGDRSSCAAMWRAYMLANSSLPLAIINQPCSILMRMLQATARVKLMNEETINGRLSEEIIEKKNSRGQKFILFERW
jgi:hypothetical protein